MRLLRVTSSSDWKGMLATILMQSPLSQWQPIRGKRGWGRRWLTLPTGKLAETGRHGPEGRIPNQPRLQVWDVNMYEWQMNLFYFNNDPQQDQSRNLPGWLHTAWHRSSTLAVHPAAPGSILSAPKNFSLDIAMNFWRHSLKQWTEPIYQWLVAS